MQYRATLTTTDGSVTPLLREVTVAYGAPAENHAPVAVDDSGAMPEDVTLEVHAPGMLRNDTDADGDTLTAELVTEPSHGVLDFHADGGLFYTPDADWYGTDSFTYTATDGTLTSNVATVTIAVVRHAPIAEADTYETHEDVALHVAGPGVLANDSDFDGDALSATIVSGPGHGDLVLQPNGVLQYAPDANGSSVDVFTYVAGDGTRTERAGNRRDRRSGRNARRRGRTATRPLPAAGWPLQPPECWRTTMTSTARRSPHCSSQSRCTAACNCLPTATSPTPRPPACGYRPLHVQGVRRPAGVGRGERDDQRDSTGRGGPGFGAGLLAGGGRWRHLLVR